MMLKDKDKRKVGGKMAKLFFRYGAMGSRKIYRIT